MKIIDQFIILREEDSNRQKDKKSNKKFNIKKQSYSIKKEKKMSLHEFNKISNAEICGYSCVVQQKHFCQNFIQNSPANSSYQKKALWVKHD